MPVGVPFNLSLTTDDTLTVTSSKLENTMSLRDIRRTNDQRHKHPQGIPPDTPGRVQSGIGRQMTAVRKARGYSKSGLATEADVGLLSLEAWETGPTTIDALQKLLGVLGCHLVVTKTSITVVNGVTPKNWVG